MRIVHLTASSFVGGPERQMLELARSLPRHFQTGFLSFGKRLSGPFLAEVLSSGFWGRALSSDFPYLFAAGRELVAELESFGAHVLCCHGYKANLLGLLAARQLGIPALAVARGWTGESLRVRVYEALDRRLLSWMARVVCVSNSMAERVSRAGILRRKIVVIRNAVRVNRFVAERRAGEDLRRFFPSPPRFIVGAAGRLSIEKGFEVLIDAAARVVEQLDSAGFILFGEGRLRERLQRRIEQANLQGAFVLAGHSTNLDCYLPHFDVTVVPSFTEGLSNVILESCAAGIPVVATRVGGNPELVEDGVSGFLVRPGASDELARRILDVLGSEYRGEMGRCGRQRVLEDFSFTQQAAAYDRLFRSLIDDGVRRWAARATPAAQPGEATPSG